MRVRRQIGQQWMERGIDSRSQFGPMSSGDGRTAIAVSSAHRLYFAAAGAVIVHRLPHAAGMRQRRRDRHAHGDKYPDEQKHQQHLAVRRYIVRLRMLITSIGDARPARKCLNQQSRGVSRRRLSGRAPLDSPRSIRNCGALLRRTAGAAVPTWSSPGPSTSSAPSARHP